uniref:Short-wave-sensitive opsin 1 n=1 Tax=Callithrix jacchus TaxID=9483 RepID=A0A8I3WHL8_CALJA
GFLIPNFVLRRFRISVHHSQSPSVFRGGVLWGGSSIRGLRGVWGIHEQDVRGRGVLSVQEHLLGGAVGWASVPPHCPFLGLLPPGSFHGHCLPYRVTTEYHGAGGHSALQKVAASPQLRSGQRVCGRLPSLHLLRLPCIRRQLSWILRLWPPCLCSGGLPGHCSRYIAEGLQCSCGPDWYTVGTKYRSEYYTWFLFIFCFIVPLALICFSYAQLLRALKAVAAQQQESATTQKAEREVSRMVVVMVGSFCVCYVPYAALAMYMVNNRNHGLDLRLVTIPAFFSKSSCIYNPIIYSFMNKQFRACIMEMVCGKAMTDESDISSSQKTEVSTVSSSQVGPN